MLPAWVIWIALPINLVGGLVYIYEIFRGRVQPNRVTWLLWGSVGMVAFFAQIDSGVGAPALFTLTAGVPPLIIFACSFFAKGAYWKLGLFDYLCGLVSVAAFGAYLGADHAVAAIALSVAASFFAGVPTVRKSWTHPGSENALLFTCGAVAGLLTALTVDVWTFESVSVALYVSAMSATNAFLIFTRLGERIRGVPVAAS